MEANFGESPFVYDFEGMLTVSNALRGFGDPIIVCWQEDPITWLLVISL